MIVRLLIAAIFILPVTCCGQNFQFDTTTENGDFGISTVISNALYNKDRIFILAKEWVYKTYKSGDAVILTDDKESGRLLCQGITHDLVYMNSFVKKDGGRFKYNLSIFCKDGKIKAVISEIFHYGGDMIQMRDGSKYSDDFPSTWGKFGKSQSSKEWPKMKTQALIEFEVLLKSLDQAITKMRTDENF